MGSLARSETVLWNGRGYAAIHLASLLVRDCPDPAARFLYQRVQLVS